MLGHGNTLSPSMAPVSSETQPLLPKSHLHHMAKASLVYQGDVENGYSKSYIDDVLDNKRQLGLVGTTFLIFNHVVGAGVFAAPCLILKSSGSVGMTFVMWILGALVATAGIAVHAEFGTGLPPSSGTKAYMEYVYRHPAFMITCVYALYTMFIGWISPASVGISEYALHALGYERTPTNSRIMAFVCSTFCLIVQGAFPKLGRRLQNAFGSFKLVVLVLIAGSGLLSLIGVPGFAVGQAYDQPNNYTWQTFWEGSNFEPNTFMVGMSTVIWCYVGYLHAIHDLSKVRDPARTIKTAVPLAMFFVALTYVSVNVAYFAVVSKGDILNASAISAALLFRNLYGPATERMISAVISLSMLGNILSNLLAQGKVIQELGREGIFPCTSLFASNKPFNTPLFGFFTQYLFSLLLIVLAPPGDIYLFIINYDSYPVALLNIFISGGLLLLYTDSFKSYDWNPPFRAYKSSVVFFFLANIILVMVPMIPPSNGYGLYKHLPYYSHIVLALLVGLLALVYWFVAFWWLPQRNGYTLRQVAAIQDDGVPRNVITRIPIGTEPRPLKTTRHSLDVYL